MKAALRKSTAIDWDGFFAEIKRITAKDAKPYVTRVAEKFPDDAQERAFAVLIATVLSLRTRDKVNEIATERLFALGKSPGEIAALDPLQVREAVKMTTFPAAKVKSVKGICEILLEKYGGKVPESLEALDELPGVGRKTANLVLIEGFRKPGICVDTHVHRILNGLGFVKTKTADETELVLREVLPKKHWGKINLYLVLLGMNHCRPGRPLEGECLALLRFKKDF